MSSSLTFEIVFLTEPGAQLFVSLPGSKLGDLFLLTSQIWDFMCTLSCLVLSGCEKSELRVSCLYDILY